MKTMRFLITAGTLMLAFTTSHPSMCQGPDTDRQTVPDEKWDVNKEYDEHGNLMYYDSTYARTWKHFGFPEEGNCLMLEDLDSMFGDFLHFPEGMFEHDHFSFSPFHEFMDSLNFDFFPDSLFFHGSPRFEPFGIFTDSVFRDSFVPLEEFIPPSFNEWNGFFDKHQEFLEKFRQEFSLPGDTMHRLHPKWQQWPGQQKNRPRGIEI